MKKVIAFICVLSLVLSLCACKSGKSGGEQTTLAVNEAHTQTRDHEDSRLHSAANDIADGVFTGSLSDFNDEEKEMIRSYLLDRNYKIEFKEDGTAELSRAGETWIITNKWIKNSYTEDVPEQTIGTVTMAMEDLTVPGVPKFVIMIKSDSEEDSYEKYKKSLTDDGFVSVGGEYYDDDDVYVGVKDDKIKIKISFTGKGYMLRIIKIDQSVGN